MSAGSNIAEASRRVSRKDKARILNVGQRESADVMSELDIACRLKYPGIPIALELIEQYDRLGASLEALRQSILKGDERQPR